MKLGLVFVTLLAFSQVCFSFHEVPHMLVLGIAKRELMKNDMEIYNITAKYLDTFSVQSIDSISVTSYEENAVWADDIKVYGNAQKAWEMWHYIGNNDSNPEKLTMKKDPMADSENALKAYTNIINVLTNDKYIGKITEYKIQMLKMLTHIVGDIHMPHHTGSFYNTTYHNDKNEYWGDLGGNRQNITFTSSTGQIKDSNIHTFFDSSCFFYTWKDRLVRPLNDTFKIYFERELDRIIAQYPKTSLKIDTTKDFNDWADESWNVALNEVYPFLMKDKNIKFGDEFYNKSFNMIQQRIVLAGYRLAYTLQSVFSRERGLIEFTPLSYQKDNSKNLPKDNTTQDKNSEKTVLTESSSSETNEANKAMAVVFGVLFGLTFVSFIAAIFYFKKSNTNGIIYQRTSNDLLDVKTLQNQRSSSNENKV